MTLDLGELHSHTPNAKGDWDELKRHLEAVGELAAGFARKFGHETMGRVLGLCHDLGKINLAFQEYLDAQYQGRAHPKVPHSVWAAALFYALLWLGKKDHESWKELALPLAGHHSGLDQPGNLSQRIQGFLNSQKGEEALCLMKKVLPQIKLSGKVKTVNSGEKGRDLLIRMLFSTLVDADYLDTERHFHSDKAEQRGKWPSLCELWRRFVADQEELLKRAEANPSKVNTVRREVYDQCLKAAEKKPGVFRLTVPTGGGKTRSGLAFALKHAMLNGLDRVIVALPYTSIIDQTAVEYRNILEKEGECVLEHHSQVEIPDEDEDQDPKHLRYRLASENWDAPIIVTTTVQLFESLFAAKPGRCRKLHNIAKSVLILDEVQTLPPELLAPTLAVLRLLVDCYGVSVVLSTATQPAFDETPYLKAFDGIKIKPIVEQYSMYFKSLERVKYQPVRQLQDINEIVDELVELPERQVLVILNTRKQALALLNRLQDSRVQGLCHLSTLLCGAHRKSILEEVKKRLDPNSPQPVYLISTQVVEAGVDLDFPVVYRAMGPLDRIVQAAGRCNREGRRAEKGHVIVFDWPQNTSPPGSYRTGLEDAKLLLQRNDPKRLSDPGLYREYFQCLFRDTNLDKRGILPYCRDLDYPEVAQRYKFIEDTIPIVIPGYDNGEGERKLQAYIARPSRETWHAVMPYVVNIRRREMISLQDWLEPVVGDFCRWIGKYDTETHRGLVGPFMDPADLIS